MKRGLVLTAILAVLLTMAFVPASAETKSCTSGPSDVTAGSCSITFTCPVDLDLCAWTGRIVVEGLGLVSGQIEGAIAQTKECSLIGFPVPCSEDPDQDPAPAPSEGDADICGPTVLRCEATVSGTISNGSFFFGFGVFRESVTITCTGGGLSLSAHVSCYGSIEEPLG
jgi:hypothetical protein